MVPNLRRYDRRRGFAGVWANTRQGEFRGICADMHEYVPGNVESERRAGWIVRFHRCRLIESDIVALSLPLHGDCSGFAGRNGIAVKLSNRALAGRSVIEQLEQPGAVVSHDEFVLANGVRVHLAEVVRGLFGDKMWRGGRALFLGRSCRAEQRTTRAVASRSVALLGESCVNRPSSAFSMGDFVRGGASVGATCRLFRMVRAPMPTAIVNPTAPSHR